MIADIGATRFTVAIDGPAASGKGTIARALAAHFGLRHLDTGLLYRAVGAKALDALDGRMKAGADASAVAAVEATAATHAARQLEETHLAAPTLRSALVAEAASRVAAIPEVRAALLDFQRRFARKRGGAVLDGRDIGTVICPDAEVKFFVTASDAVRARRRHAELADPARSQAEVLQDLQRRDRRDAERRAAPLIRAPDAVLIDTTELSIDAAVAQAVTVVERQINENKS